MFSFCCTNADDAEDDKKTLLRPSQKNYKENDKTEIESDSQYGSEDEYDEDTN